MGAAPTEQRASKRSRIYLREDVARHNKAGDCWVVCNDKIYDVRTAAPFHPVRTCAC